MRSAWKRFTTALDQNQQGSLLILAGLFLVFNAVTLSFSPAGRLRSWEAVYRWKHWAGLAVWAAGMLLIYRQSKKYLPAGDKLLAPAAALLSGWGLLMIWRLTGEFGLRQSIWLGISVLLFSAGLRFQGGLTLLRRYKYVWLFAGLGLTALTLFLGTNPLGFGPRLWLGCCGIYFQPSEPLKLLFIVYLAAYLSERRPAHTDILSLAAPTLVVTGLALLLLIFQRDLGTASIFVFIYTAVMYAATGQRRVLGISLIILLVSGAAGYTLYDVVRIRIDGWINPWLDPSGRSFQIVQSLMAVASGGIFGRGIGLGSPGLVPIAHSDFIFSSFSEEFGLVGIFPLLAVFAALTLRAIRIGAQAASHYHRFLALGLAAYFGSQSIYIIGGAIRLLPLTGVTLPFVSYGGSSLVTSFLALLILTRISARRGSPSLLPKDFPPLMMLTRIFLAGFSAVALAYGWWAVVRGPDLGTRTDNARRTIADRVVKRGAVLDRSGEKLIFTSGEQGDFQRSYTYPALSPILGYTHPLYGQAGAEAYIDPLLRGLEGQSPLKIWWQHLLYGQPPPGLDIRLTIDLSRQQKADGWLAGKAGSVVLLDAVSGEILAIASSPGYNANLLEEEWENLVTSTQSPLVNRPSQGSYPPGPALGPFLLAAAGLTGELPAEITALDYQLGEINMRCSSNPKERTWEAVVTAGCPAPLAYLGLEMGETQLLSLFNMLGFYHAPAVRMPTHSMELPAILPTPAASAIGQKDIRLSPLQLAQAAAALTNFEFLPPLHLLDSYADGQGGWKAAQPLASASNLDLFNPFNSPGSFWETTALAYSQDGQALTWYLAGDRESNLVVVVLLEEDDPNSAREIGSSLLQNSMR